MNKGFTPTPNEDFQNRAKGVNYRLVWGFTPLETLIYRHRQKPVIKRVSAAKFLTGFTLMEMVVAVGILSIVILISSSAFLAVLNAQRKTAAIETIQENLRFSLEIMLREIRTGQFYYCGLTAGEFGNGSNTQDCADGGPALTFRNYRGYLIVYRLKNEKIEKYVSLDTCSSGPGCQPPSSDGDFLTLTFPEIKINDLKFYVIGSKPYNQDDSSPDTKQPRVTITIRGEMNIGEKGASKFNVQTTVSQRQVDG